jgi:hypothetical protein
MNSHNSNISHHNHIKSGDLTKSSNNSNISNKSNISHIRITKLSTQRLLEEMNQHLSLYIFGQDIGVFSQMIFCLL